MHEKADIGHKPAGLRKTFISKQLAKALNHVVYLDKDTLIPLSKQIFAVAHQPYDRSSIFLKNISVTWNIVWFWTLLWKRWSTMILC